MKELTIEQKAKAYDKAIKVAMSKIKNDKDHVLYEEDITDIFPELAESEDEKIRKEIINYFEHHPNIIVKRDRKSDWIAWLEKQGEQKPADKAEPKFHEGDIIKPKDGSHEPWQIMQVDILDKKYRFKDGYVIPFSHEDNYELVEQKSAWSEEDENNILFLTSIIEECFKNKEKITLCGDTVCANFTKENVIDRLKSLRPQNHWRPSEEQMDALDDVISSRDIKYDVLSELWKDLKQLK